MTKETEPPMRRILVIDDDPAIRASTRRLLERAGYTVLEADEGKAGMRLLEADPVDLVLTDIYMPGEDGFATIRHLRRDFPAIKIITMTGGVRAGLADLSDTAAALGAASTLRKPFNKAQLLDAVRGALM